MAAGITGQSYPCTSVGAVRIPTVIAPIPTKKITPKLTIPVIPVCKFNEKDIKINIESVNRTLET